jgi:hypothetical protein
MKKQIKNANDLINIVSNWVDTFNFIQLEVLEKMADDCLFEYIRQTKMDYDEFLDNYGDMWNIYKEWLKEDEMEDNEENKAEFCENRNEWDDYYNDSQQENYPMWNTCFEFKNEEQEDVIQAAIDAGFGIIEGLEPFNTVLFVSGCGYSFYGAHWIPLYLNLPWNKDAKKQVAELGIKYDNL